MKTSENLRRALGVAVLAGSALVLSGSAASAQTSCPTTTTAHTTPPTTAATTSTTQSQSQSQSPQQSPAVAEDALGGFKTIAQTSCPSTGSNALASTGMPLAAVATVGGGAGALALAARRAARGTV